MNSKNSSRRSLIGIEATAWCFSVAVVDVESGILLKQSTSIAVPTHGLHQADCVRQHSSSIPKIRQEVLDYVETEGVLIEKIVYSRGPGFIKCLRSGFELAVQFGELFGVEVEGVHHGVGHLALVVHKLRTGIGEKDCVLYVSGGHTHFLRLDQCGKLRVILETPDLAIGNLLDKIGRIKGLAHPAGPKLEDLYLLSRNVESKPFCLKLVNPSYNGMTTKFSGYTGPMENMAVDLLDTVFNNLSAIILNYCVRYQVENLFIVGGVAQSTVLHSAMNRVAQELSPDLSLCYVLGRQNSDSGYNIALASLEGLSVLTDSTNQNIDPHLAFKHAEGATLCETRVCQNFKRGDTIRKRVCDSLVLSLAGYSAKRRFKRKISGFRKLQTLFKTPCFKNLVLHLTPQNIDYSTLSYETKFIESEVVSHNSSDAIKIRFLHVLGLIHNSDVILGEIRSSHLRISKDSAVLITWCQNVEHTHKTSSKVSELQMVLNLLSAWGLLEYYSGVVDYCVLDELRRLKCLRRYA